MPDVTLDHFKIAAADLGAHGDNDTLPFDVDNRFIKERRDALATLAYAYFTHLESMTPKEVSETIGTLNIFSERLLVPTGPAGFRITTKMSPFWNIYLNGLGVAIAEKHEASRSPNAHSYRYLPENDGLFDRTKSWRAYKEATLADKILADGKAFVVQTDISAFYEHVYHHRLENCLQDLFPSNHRIAKQVDRLLNKFSAGRSFGLPVGGQCARILAELLMSSVDTLLTSSGVTWHRYVDDFTLICQSQEDAYRALSKLSHALANNGLSLNRSKTSILTAKHYQDYVQTQLGTTDGVDKDLREIDLHYDPYSDSPDSDYESLRTTVQNLNVSALLNLELNKSQPDTFLLSQIARTLKFQTAQVAIQLCQTLLDAKNLHAFRASWATIMRGIAAVRDNAECAAIFPALDKMLDEVPAHSEHLLLPEANCLHYLKTIRFAKTDKRAQYVTKVFDNTGSDTVKRACIECWKHWKDRPSFTKAVEEWSNLRGQSQRMLWLATYEFTDAGRHFRGRVKASLPSIWGLGVEQPGQPTFVDTYLDWAANGV